MWNLARACWFPPELEDRLKLPSDGRRKLVRRYSRDDDEVDVVFDILSPDAVEIACSFLSERQSRALRQKSVYDIAQVLDVAAQMWLDPDYELRRRAIHQIALITGFSAEMVAHSIDLEQKSSRYPHLIQALCDELGDPLYLDGFRANRNLCGFSRAHGPGLIGAIFSSNIPALPHLEVMRALLVKSACLGRVSRNEPVFLSLYAQTLYELDPELASCIAVIYWDHDDQPSEQAFLNGINHLVAYGGMAQIDRLCAIKPPSLEATWHGHKIGLSYITRQALTKDAVEDMARKVSYDFSVFDGHACLCPQVCLVETGGDVSPVEFAEHCARQMRAWANELPPGRQEISEASGKYHLRELYLLRESMGEAVSVIDAPADLSYMVILEEGAQFEAAPGGRFLKIVPVADFLQAELYMKPARGFLQNVALAVGHNDAPDLRDLGSVFAALGAARIVPPGIMGTPSMTWHHDGMACLGRLVRWCDYELLEPENLLDIDPEAYLEGIKTR
ncbi:MAG TPA: acyl-CoA reductase [Blastocatellia bacterium]|nr:acyl-CoA reductase [Blastocatellia bacterium]